MNARSFAALVALCIGVSSAAAVEQVTIPSADAKLRLVGYWFKADASDPRPAVISLHGCNGAVDAKGNLNPVWKRDAGFFNAEKMHLLVLDSFTPRGEASICETPPSRRGVDEQDRRDDVFAALQWLADQPGVDRSRLAVVGRSHGGSTVLSVMDRTDKLVQRQAVQPRAAVALYPGCARWARMWNYDVSAPLLILSGELDDWTPAADCRTLRDSVVRSRKEAPIELVIYPGSYHGFDSTAPVAVRTNVGSTRSGTATVGGNPQARENSHARLFGFLAEQMGLPLVLSHDERLHGHHYRVPPASGFARIDDVSAVPLDEKGRARYEHYLTLEKPKAFAITEKGGWYFSANDTQAMKTSLEYCARANVRCWLFAVDDKVVWDTDAAARLDLAKLQKKAP